MIYYFSTTGNSQWVAEALARETGDRAGSITELVKRGEIPPPVRSGEVLGIVFPVYAWAPPRFVVDFVRRLEVEPGAFVYAVATMGEFAGDAVRLLGKSIALDSGYTVKMPANYILMYNRESDKSIAAKIAEARKLIPQIGEGIRAKRREFRLRRGPCPALISALVAPLFSRFARDRKFAADNRCTGCGLCVKLCPLDNITLENGRPVWHGDCMQCVACIQNCPARAIDYGRATRRRLQYRLDETIRREE